MDILDTNELKKLISRKMTLLLEKSGKTIEATAYDLDMEFSQYYRLLRGQRLPILPTLLRFNKLYGVNMDWWFAGVDYVPPPRQTRTRANPLELQLIHAFRKLNDKSQKTAVAVLRTLARNLG
ncbi:MAG: helix-turn-helix transcriptional regulator [Candidatus Margulisbacteria bacterium]|jgi:transcriptional regulator with XRE-family HTH domain|nr:helix-turn-helix transcriptional regulator [Candidatus Margulisiibacteriota bacterium]